MPNVRANYLASPPLVVAYALLGKMTDDITTEPLGNGKDGKPVYLRDIWPTNKEIADIVAACLSRDQFLKRYGEVFKGPKQWQTIEVDTDSETYRWSDGSTYVKNPPYFEGITMDPPPVGDIKGARILAELGDSITTDHISPAGSIRKASPAGDYLLERQVLQKDFNSYGARRGNHEIMMRGTFANIRIRNEMLTSVEGGMTRHLPSGEQMPIYDAAMRYKAEGVPLVVFGGKEYGTGSSRDWAAKGTLLLGIKAVIVESFERIHRSNLVGMGVLPLTFKEGTDRKSLGITGEELIDIVGPGDGHHAADGSVAGDPPTERQSGHGAGDLPHRYGGRSGVLPPRRHPALRAARHGEGGLIPTLRVRLQQLSGSLNLPALSLAEGVRAALSVAVIIALNEYLQWPPLIMAALAALNTCMGDPGGAIRRRVPVLLTFTVLGALVVAGVGLARGYGIAVALPLGMFGLFCATFVRIYGETAQMLGVLLGVMLIISLDRAVPDVMQAGVMAAVFIGGGLWATLLTLVIWPIYPYMPARRAVAEVYRALSAATDNLRTLAQAGDTDEAAWDAHAHTNLSSRACSDRDSARSRHGHPTGTRRPERRGAPWCHPSGVVRSASRRTDRIRRQTATRRCAGARDWRNAVGTVAADAAGVRSVHCHRWHRV